MDDDDRAERPAPLLATPPLDRLGIVELRQYIMGLEAEIERARGEIVRKEGIRTAADRVFRRG